jgi:hypothetical protein
MTGYWNHINVYFLLMWFYSRTGLNYNRAIKAVGVIIVVIVITCLTAYMSWKSLKSVDDRDFVKKLWELNLNNSDSGNRSENTSKTSHSLREYVL